MITNCTLYYYIIYISAVPNSYRTFDYSAEYES